MTLIVPALMPMLIFGGAMPLLDELTMPLSKVLPSRWAFEGMLQLLSLDANRPYFFPAGDHYSVETAAWVLAAMVAILFTVVAIILKSRDAH